MSRGTASCCASSIFHLSAQAYERRLCTARSCTKARTAHVQRCGRVWERAAQRLSDLYTSTPLHLLHALQTSRRMHQPQLRVRMRAGDSVEGFDRLGGRDINSLRVVDADVGEACEDLGRFDTLGDCFD